MLLKDATSGETPKRPQRQKTVRLIDPPAGYLEVLRLERCRDLRNRQVVGPQLVAIELDVDLPLAARQ
jgi:hypothetical protein